MSVRDVVALVGLVLSLDAAFFLTRAMRRPTRSELQELGSGAILQSGCTEHLFGIRSELVRTACMEWQYDRTGMVVLCLSVAAQAFSQVVSNSRHVHILFALCVPLSVAVLTLFVGRLLANRSTALFIQRMVIAEIRRNQSLRRTPPVARTLPQEDREEVQLLVRCLLSGLVPNRAIDEFTSRVQGLLGGNE
jgi:hypothetical protein